MSLGEGFGFEIWMSEPQSVEKRRQNFMSQMGLSNDVSSSSMRSNGGEEEIVGLELLERVYESSNAECSSSSCTDGDGISGLVCFGRESCSEANSMADDDLEEEEEFVGRKPGSGSESSEGEVSTSQKGNVEKMKRRWSWKQFVNNKMRDDQEVISSDLVSKASSRLAKVKCNKKKYMELSGLFVEQEIQAHKGFIWTMKFSPDGKYLATGGEDGIIRIWQVGTTPADSKLPGVGLKKGGGQLHHQPSIVIPEMVFRIEESPVHEFRGHSSDVLDLAWSSSNLLLSSSKDNTVRLWQVGCNDCLNVFHHRNYVTCIQFNPVNENYFISGSIDGKVRIWGVHEARVIEWADVRDAISSICYKPDGKGFVVGTIRGRCRFYEVSANDLQLEAEIRIQGRKRTSGNRITGIQFSQDKAPKVMITSEDSKVRIFDGFDLIHKFKGLPRSGNQMSASFTSTGKHIISVGDDCQVYVWNYNDQGSFYGGGGSPVHSKHIKSEQSFEHFSSQGVSVAVPWPGSNKSSGGEVGDSGSQGRFLGQKGTGHGGGRRASKDMDRFSLANWRNFMEGGRRGNSSSAATWPEERLPGWDDGAVDRKPKWFDAPATWGMVIVTGSWDGKISTFNNYGLPMIL
ncbi:unnamed protein product [Linum tenue]|uniref:Uncharacterized protein n=1 Tax=Linum tenue TaxID=586396 RepID=A0AAV0RBL6_9ROSI|nr:unnamed protein product [Linum tenue]